ncbi:MAG: transcriptional regulator [Nitrososphaerota archaeon]|nr:transcriptional regulator [Nitrososphaerota archaeon]
MTQYRTQVKIIADVLSTARDMNVEGNGVGITALLRRGNMSYGRMTKLLSELVGSGLLTELSGDKISKYMISDKGVQFLTAYHSFEDFAQSFGLRL